MYSCNITCILIHNVDLAPTIVHITPYKLVVSFCFSPQTLFFPLCCVCAILLIGFLITWAFAVNYIPQSPFIGSLEGWQIFVSKRESTHVSQDSGG